MPSVDLIRVSGLFFELNILVIEDTTDSKCLGKEPLRFRVEKQRRKIAKTWEGGGASRQPAPSKWDSEVHPLGRRSIQPAPAASLAFEGWHPTPLRAPGTPVLPIRSPPFSTCSLVMYLRFLVDSNTLRYI
ncbi:hypothetical protein MTR67_027058 [Solanum verrucosum]|uniref:Uncharacterized protein n=1 Tax=Solanum verrucosum TaxID=315347 RepID=A0AAF0R2Y3_SOLVR|nr:hypothetical protein MTR67_027058 [Solanum verrucosum]